MSNIQFINKDKIIEAYILEPYENCGEFFDHRSSHGWQVKFIVGYDNEHYPHAITVDRANKQSCVDTLANFNLIEI